MNQEDFSIGELSEMHAMSIHWHEFIQIIGTEHVSSEFLHWSII